MSKTIKNNLFRFVTLRNPQLIDKKEGKPGFVFHPDEKSGKFFSVVLNKAAEERPSLLKQAAENYTSTAVKTRTEARAINEKLYLFSSWLMQHKNALSFSEIRENTTDVVVLDNNEVLTVWDNLIYQTIEKKSTYVREAMIQLLITNQFLNAFIGFADGLSDDITFTDDQEKEFVRRANASVVMSKKLFDTTEIPTTDLKKRLTRHQKKTIDNALEVEIAKSNLSAYSLLLEELKRIEVSFSKENKNNYDKALDEYNLSVEKELVKAIPVTVIKIDETTGEEIEIDTYPELDTPKFSFQSEKPITADYLTGKLSDVALSLFEAEKLDIYDTFSEVESYLKQKISGENKIIQSKGIKKTKNVKIGGAMLRVEPDPVSELGVHCFKGFIRQLSGRTMISLQVNAGYVDPEATITYTLTNQTTGSVYTQPNSVSGYGPETIDNIRFVLNPQSVPAGTYTFEATLNFNDGTQVMYEVTDITILDKGNKPFSGCKKTDNNQPPVISAPNNEVFGITNLGIADFRRVEQEVCCYVPGEVSHIENVMAREYKERSTRNLVSSEVTTERSEERERENLTDTTTTERNEMQTEVSSVLNEDQAQSQGGNANMSYNGKVSFSAGAYFDSSSGSSTSDSNSQAQTYAQEVTERAMERIVEKTQTKRTSRILKEFEENNKHGFDNTKGDQHVTGVYRWVDKIYKNTLINYGKRLMYEFAIPEPSKFFKEAIWKQVDQGQLESGVIIPEAPVHPSKLTLQGGGIVKDASQLTPDNYQELAAEYAADVNSISISKKVSESFSLSGNSTLTDRNYTGSANFNMKLPAGYKATSANVNAGFVFVPKRLEYTYATVSVGNRHFTAGNAPHWDYEVYLNIDDVEDELAVSATGSDIGGLRINVVANCSVTDEALAQWQNETYTAILDAYNVRLQEYNDAQNQDIITIAEEEKLGFNPLFNRSLEKKELKRVAIEFLTEQKGINVSVDNYGSKNEDTSVSKVNKNATLKQHASAVKFFEQAFDWDIMAYIFYPYFYADEKDWEKLFQEQDAADPLFQAFLQSGMARTVVPVRPGFEDAVNWYMETGEIWNGQGLVVDQDDDLYVSVAEEMQTIEGQVEATWETRLPTALTILQAQSASLLEGGLPCFCDEHSNDNTIVSSSELISGDDGSAGVGVDLLN